MASGFDRLFENYSADKLSKAGDRSEGGLACPRCGSENFKLKRSLGQKAGLAAGVTATVATGGLGVMYGAAGVAGAAKAKRVVCVPCGMSFERG